MGVNKDLIKFLEEVDFENANLEDLRADLLEFKGRGADFSYVLKDKSPLQIAINRNSLELFKLIHIIGEGNLNQVLGENEQSLVHIAVERQRGEILQYMINQNVNLDVYDARNLHPATCAASANGRQCLIIILGGLKKQVQKGEFQQILLNSAKVGLLNEQVEALKILISFGLSLESFQNPEILNLGEKAVQFLSSIQPELRYTSICHTKDLQMSDFKFIKKFHENGYDISNFVSLLFLEEKLFNMPLSTISQEPLFINYPASLNANNIAQHFARYLQGEMESGHNVLRMLFSALFAIRKNEVQFDDGVDKFLLNLLKITEILPQKYGMGEMNKSMKQKYPRIEEFDEILKITQIPASKNYGVMLLAQKTFENQELPEKLEQYLQKNPQFQAKLLTKLDQLKEIVWPATNSISNYCNLLQKRLQSSEKQAEIQSIEELSSSDELSANDSNAENEVRAANSHAKKLKNGGKSKSVARNYTISHL